MESRDNTGRIDKQVLLKYLRGELSPDEAWKVEKAMLDDPFLAEAMEGLETASKEGSLEEDLDDLERAIRVRTEKTRKITGFTYVRAAAVLLVLAVITYVVVEFAHRVMPRNEIAIQKIARPDTAASPAYNESGKAVAEENNKPASPTGSHSPKQNEKKYTPPVLENKQLKVDSISSKANENLAESKPLTSAESGAGQARQEIADLEKSAAGPEGTNVKTEISLPASRELNEKPDELSISNELSGEKDKSVQALGAGKTDDAHAK